jgi:DNA-binding beta-propeller fold protein YncE
MVLTSDGKVLWVSARGDNRVLAFNPTALETDPDHALLGFASTGGIAPVGIALFQHEQLLAVANSNRFPEPTNPGKVTILNVTNPAGARLLATVAAQLFPREVTVGMDDSTLYVTNFSSNQLQVIATTSH